MGRATVTVLVALASQAIFAQASVQGQWGPSHFWVSTPGVANTDELAHASLIPTGPHAGKVLIWEQTLNQDQSAYIVDPAALMAPQPSSLRGATGAGSSADLAPIATMMPIPGGAPNPLTNIFCAGHARYPDGRLLIAGGTAHGSTGLSTSFVYDNGADPATSFVPSGNMTVERWYPTTIALSDGRLIAAGGWISGASTVQNNIELYDPVTQTFCLLAGSTPGWSLSTYPRLHMLPSGALFFTGERREKGFVTIPASCSGNAVWAARPWSAVPRNDGCSVLLPLEPPGYAPRLMITGGSYYAQTGSGGHSSVELNCDPVNCTSGPCWTLTAPMSFSRVFANLVLLPDKSVLAVGGASAHYSQSNPVTAVPRYVPELFRLTGACGGAWTQMAQQPSPRLYHSTALLVKSGAVLSTGGQQPPGAPNSDGELFMPPYFFNGPRPTLEHADGEVVTQGVQLYVKGLVQSSDPITSLVLMRAGSVTHHFDFEQRLVELGIQTYAEDGLGSWAALTLPIPGTTILPKGFYLLFAVSQAGLPSQGAFVQVY